MFFQSDIIQIFLNFFLESGRKTGKYQQSIFLTKVSRAAKHTIYRVCHRVIVHVCAGVHRHAGCFVCAQHQDQQFPHQIEGGKQRVQWENQAHCQHVLVQLVIAAQRVVQALPFEEDKMEFFKLN